MKAGWFCGNFEPTVFKTQQFEVGYKLHPKNSKWDVHYHAIAVEITFLLKGKMKIKDQIIESGQIFILEPFEVADPEFLEDCEVVVVKTPSVPGDKYLCCEESTKSNV